MFEKYNAALRGGALAPNANQPEFMRANFEKHCKGNRYPTTLHLISSGIMKLGKLTTVGYVYRGMGKDFYRTRFGLQMAEVTAEAWNSHS